MITMRRVERSILGAMVSNLQSVYVCAKGTSIPRTKNWKIEARSEPNVKPPISPEGKKSLRKQARKQTVIVHDVRDGGGKTRYLSLFLRMLFGAAWYLDGFGIVLASWSMVRLQVIQGLWTVELFWRDGTVFDRGCVASGKASE